MLYTNPQKLEALETSHPHFESNKDYLHQITEMCEGGVSVAKNLNDYLLVRDDEPSEIKRKRAEKFITRNHLGSAIRLQRTKLSTGSLNVDQDSLPGDKKRWQDFLPNVDKKGKHLKDFLLDAIEQALQTQYVFCLIDKPVVQIPTGVNQAQLDNYLKANKLDEKSPHLILLNPLQVIHYDESDEGVNWIKFKQLIPIAQPLGETLYNLVYVLVDNQHYTTFTFENVKLNENGVITQIWDRVKQQYRSFDKDKDLAAPKSIAHNRGATPITKLEIPNSLYTASQAYLAQKVIYGLDANLLHTTVNSGFIQKWGQPFLISNGTSLAAPVPEYLQKAMKEFQTNMGDESFLAAEQFSFAELKGDSIAIQQEVIKSLEKYIYSVISMGIASAEPQTLEQSGVSKQMDHYLANQTLVNLGAILTQFAGQVLKQVGRALGIKDESALSLIKVEGLDDFDLDSISSKLEIVERMAKLPGAPSIIVPAALFEDAVTDLASVMTRSSDDLLTKKVKEQMEIIYSNPVQLQPAPTVNNQSTDEQIS